MVLFINTTRDDRMAVALATPTGRILIWRNVSIRYDQGKKLLPAIRASLRTTKATLENLQGIIVAEGPGGFTAVRIGVVTANALAFSLGIPVVGVRSSAQSTTKNTLLNGLKKFKRTKMGAFVAPFYGREPNITPTPVLQKTHI